MSHVKIFENFEKINEYIHAYIFFAGTVSFQELAIGQIKNVGNF
jgi:hypothetical protein